MATSPAPYPTLDEWVAREAFPFAIDDPHAFDAAVDRMVAALGDVVEILGLGEPLHGSEAFLRLRNRVFRRLAAAHGYSAIAVESSFPRGVAVNDYVLGRGSAAASFDHLRDTG